MNIIIIFAKYLLLIEIALTVFFLGAVYWIKFYKMVSDQWLKSLDEKTYTIILNHLQNNTSFNSSEISILSQNVHITLNRIEFFDAKTDVYVGWKEVRKDIIKMVFLPTVYGLYESRHVYERSFAAKLLFFCFDEKDLPIVKFLIHDRILLVSIEASLVGFKYSSEVLINASIDVFSKSKMASEAIFLSIAADCDEQVEDIIVKRILQDDSPDVREFCYQLLIQFKTTHHFVESLQRDLDSDLLSLRLVALNYAAHNTKSHALIPLYLNDKQWEMRAAAAKFIGEMKDVSSAPLLEKALTDDEWWVRMRAAESLSQLGEKGRKILKAQSAEFNKFAYDAATEALLGEEEGSET